MSQPASTHLLIPELSEDLISSEPWSIESYADGFMDELFADIDCCLDGRRKLTNQTVQYSSRTPIIHSEYVELPKKVSQIILPETHNQQPIQTVSSGGDRQLNTFVVNAPTARKPVGKKFQKTRIFFGNLLSIGATVGIAIAGMIFLFHSGSIYRINSKLIQQSIQQPQLAPQLPTKVEVEADLVHYMLGALAVIDRQEAKSSLSAKTALTATRVAPTQTAFAYVTTSQPRINPPGANLPPVLTANNIQPAPSRTVVERIYIPVYQAPAPMRYAPPPIAGLSRFLPPVPQQASKSKSAPVKNALNSVGKAPKPVSAKIIASAVRTELKPVPVRTAPITLRQPSKPLPVLPVTAFRVLPPKLPTAKAPEESPAPTSKTEQKQAYVETVVAPNHTLEGLLELGNKSAALFKIDGVTHRVDVGNNIGSSGWTLVDVSKGEAVVRRNGEVRSIYTGQNL